MKNLALKIGCLIILTAITTGCGGFRTKTIEFQRADEDLTNINVHIVYVNDEASERELREFLDTHETREYFRQRKSLFNKLTFDAVDVPPGGASFQFSGVKEDYKKQSRGVMLIPDMPTYKAIPGTAKYIYLNPNMTKPKPRKNEYIAITLENRREGYVRRVNKKGSKNIGYSLSN